MVLDSLFIVKDFVSEGSEIKAMLEVNESHGIFNGHFPGQPVLPGVCMMQSVKELVERQSGEKLTVTAADNMKFLSVLDPRANKVISALITVVRNGSKLSVTATLFADSITFFKLKAVLTPSIAQQ